MALCCIGGVCVPYSAVWAVLALCLKWLLTHAVRAGVIPQAWVDRLGLQKIIGNATMNSNASNCCNDGKACCGNDTASAIDVSALPVAPMPHIDDVDDWDALWKKQSNSDSKNAVTVVAKMTATWCRPCQQIQPQFGKLASHYQKEKGTVRFCTVDVDACDAVAAQFKVAMMPTFLILRQERDNVEDIQVVDRYAGSDAAQLSNFLAQHLS